MLYYLSLGSNLGDREATLLRACELIGERIGVVTRRSSFYYSEPWGFESEHAFCNICIALDTALLPMEVLRLTQAIERELGRTQKSQNGIYHDRTIDIDLLLCYDGATPVTWPPTDVSASSHPSPLGEPERVLTLPHPLMQERDFVMVPLSEIAPALK